MVSARQLVEDIKSGKQTAEAHVHEQLSLISKHNKAINALLFVNGEALQQARIIDKKREAKQPLGKLAGVTVAIKSCISVFGLPVTAGSKTLEKYTGTFDADVVARIKAEDGIIIGMANMDEFASGSSGEHSAFGATQNPKAPGRVSGGSSSGSAASVAAGFCDVALGTDTGGSIRNPASHCGIVGIKPSYGRVSRYGLLDLSMSLDQAGALANDVESAALVHSVIDGSSENDPSTQTAAIGNYLDPKQNRLTVGISAEFEALCTDRRIWDAVMGAVKKFCEYTHSKTTIVELKHVPLAIAAYYPLVYTEFYSATRKYDGRKYGAKIEDFAGPEVQRRIAGGKVITEAEYAGQYYRKALGVKHAIAKDFEKAFEHCDIIVSPVTPKIAPRIGEVTDPEDEYAFDAFTIPANFAGICSGVAPCTVIDGCPIGVQVMAPAFQEERLFFALRAFEKSRK